MGMLTEFKEFAMRGSVVDLAVGVIIGGAFGKIVTALVDGIIMPPIGLLFGGVNFKELAYVLRPAVLDAAGKVMTPAVSVQYGMFVQTLVDFLIIAFVIFLAIKAMNRLSRKQEVLPAAPALPPEEVLLLREIRDSLKNPC
jgi:large conductance mechanosensitive channel